MVTGATSGIGRATAQILADAGAEVFLVARRAERLARLATRISAHPLPADLGDTRRVQAMAEGVFARLEGAPDIVVHAAGVFTLAPLHRTSTEEWDRAWQVNLRGAFLLVRAFLTEMVRRGSGRIVTVGSVAGWKAFPENGAYSASKFGLRGLHEVLVEETRGTGVGATLVEPGACATPIWDSIDRSRHPGLPLRDQMLDPRDVAEAIFFAVTRPPGVRIPLLRIEPR